MAPPTIRRHPPPRTCQARNRLRSRCRDGILPTTDRRPNGDAAPQTAAERAGRSRTNKHWYVVKVQSGREEIDQGSHRAPGQDRGLEDCFGQIVIPVEKVTEMRNGKRVVKERKLLPGYLMVQVEFNDRISICSARPPASAISSAAGSTSRRRR